MVRTFSPEEHIIGGGPAGAAVWQFLCMNMIVQSSADE